MSTVAPQISSALMRPLAVRMRPDLIHAPQRVAGRRLWAIKDPVSMAYFRLTEEEHAVLEMLDGQATVAEVIDLFEHRFAPRRLTPEQLQAYVARLHSDALLVAEGAGQGQQLIQRARRDRRRRLLDAFANPLAIRLRGFNPSPLLDQLYPLVRWLFAPAVVAIGMAIVGSALLLAITHWNALAARLPSAHEFVTPRTAVYVLLAISLTKVLHEFGHALTARHFGGECHELGPMLLCGAPCLYCDVSDTWMFASRWRRMAVAVAGIYVELVLAAIATLLWWFSEPGFVSAFCLNVMVVCSVSTLLFNGNPLLRYDGYYVLADLVDIPNLAEQSQTALRQMVTRFVFGQTRRSPRMAGWRQAFLLIYGVASTLYRLLVVVALLWFAYRVLLPYRLEVLAEVLGTVVIGGMAASTMQRGWRAARTPSTGSTMTSWRLAGLVLLAAMLVAAMVFVPLPVSVTAPIVLEPQGAERVYVSEPGILKSCIDSGATVKQGEVLAKLSCPDLELDVVRLTGDLERQRLHVANLERRRGQDRTAAAELPTAREALADLEQRLERRHEQERQLVLRAPAAGMVLAPPNRQEPVPAGALRTWRRSPLSPENVGAMLDTGTLLCLVADPGRMDAVAIVDQADVERIAVGDRVQLKLYQAAGNVLQGTVREIAEIDVDVAPRQLAFARELAVRKDDAGVSHPAVASYQVRVELDEHDQPLLAGAHGRAKIQAQPQSLVARMRRWLRGTFHFAA